MASSSDSDDPRSPATHPSFGLIGARRWNAGGKGRRLFGSKLPGHNTGVTIQIKGAETETSFGHERIFGAGHPVLCEVHLSAVQWAEFLTNMNVGEGVPCTLGFIHGDTVRRPDPPHSDSDTERVRAEVKHHLSAGLALVRQQRAIVREALTGKVSAKVLEATLGAFNRVEQDLGENIPWYTEQFAEATEAIVTAAKVEIDATLTAAITQLGVQALAQLSSQGGGQLGGVAALLEDSTSLSEEPPTRIS